MSATATREAERSAAERWVEAFAEGWRAREGFRPAFELIPDLHATVHSWAADGAVVFIEFTLDGTIGGTRVRVPAVDRFILRDGLVSERVAHFDPVPVLRAVAASPRAWPKFVRMRASQLTARLRGGSR